MMRAARPRHPLGRRGACLLTLGTIYVLLGVGRVLTTDLGPSSRRAMGLALDLLPLPAWGALLIVAGLVACVTARWPAGRNGWGFLALSVTAAWWLCVYAAGALVYGSASAWPAALIWLLLVVLVQIIAGWPEAASDPDKQSSP